MATTIHFAHYASKEVIVTEISAYHGYTQCTSSRRTPVYMRVTSDEDKVTCKRCLHNLRVAMKDAWGRSV